MYTPPGAMLKSPKRNRPVSRGPLDTPWYLSKKFISVFFFLVFGGIVSTFTIQAVAIGFVSAQATKQDYSQGILPVAEKILCGSKGCLKDYL